jgi:hypothetical protein
VRVSSFFNISCGHGNLEFVDIADAPDTELFIDPCLIEVGHDAFCLKAKEVMTDYFDVFFHIYRTQQPVLQKLALFEHAHEINATKLGYGNGQNGKAKTAEGMLKTFSGIQRLTDANVKLSHAIDLPIFIEGFAEDCMSDMLTNILFKELMNFTLEQCRKYGVGTSELKKQFFFWNAEKHTWERYRGRGLVIDERVVLLVPKGIVRSGYYYNTEQYFRKIILERIQGEQTTYDKNGHANRPSKQSLRKSLLRTNSDILEISIDQTVEHPHLLRQHHSLMRSSYTGRSMSDEELDEFVYQDDTEAG